MKLDTHAVLAARDQGALPADLARKYKTTIQSIYQATSRARKDLKKMARRERLAGQNGRNVNGTNHGLVADEIASLERKKSQITDAIDRLKQIGQ